MLEWLSTSFSYLSQSSQRTQREDIRFIHHRVTEITESLFRLPGDGGKRKPSVRRWRKILIQQCFSMSRRSLGVNSKSVVVWYNNDFPRERDDGLIRFPLPGNLVKNLKPLCSLRARASHELSRRGAGERPLFSVLSVSNDPEQRRRRVGGEQTSGLEDA